MKKDIDLQISGLKFEPHGIIVACEREKPSSSII